MRACVQRLQETGYDLAGYTIAERVDDLDAARKALGYDRVDLLSESFGTRVALIYSWRHAASIKRSVMIGVNAPGHFIWKPEQTDEQLRPPLGALRHHVRRPVRLHAAHRGELPAPLGPVPDPPGQRRDRLVLRPDGLLVERRADLGADDARRLAR